MKKSLLVLTAALALGIPTGANAQEAAEVSSVVAVPKLHTAALGNFVSTSAYAKAFAGAPQNGQRNLTAVWNCNVVTSGAVRIDVTECSITTNNGTYVNRPGYGYIAVAPHPATASPVSGRYIAQVCTVAVVTFRTGPAYTTPRNCSAGFVAI